MSEQEADDTCPVCGASFQGQSVGQIEIHVNQCLDGGPPLPSSTSSREGVGNTVPAPIDVGDGSSSSSNGVSQEEGLQLLLQMYPGLPKEYALSILLACNGVVGDAVNLLDDMVAQRLEEERELLHRRREQEVTLREQRRQRHRAEAWTPPVDVELIIYDLKPEGVSSKIGFGVYHSAVIIAGKEFAFGGTQDPDMSDQPGVFVCTPETAADVVKKRCVIGQTKRTPTEVFARMDEWGAGDWKAGNYHLLSKNCNHFTAFFLQYLSEAADIPQLTELDAAYNLPIQHPPLQQPETSPPESPPAAAGSTQSPTEQQNDKKRRKAAAAFAVDEAWLQQVLPDEKKRRKYLKERGRAIEDALEKWLLPDWVNRAARFGNTLVPNFVYDKVVGTKAQETPNESNMDVPASNSDETPKAPTVDRVRVLTPPPANGGQLESAFSDTQAVHDGHTALSPTTVKVDPEKVRLVKEVLPEMSDEKIATALVRCRHDANKAIEHLLLHS